MEKEHDEYGDVTVYNEERLKALKDKANAEYDTICSIIKTAETALSGFVEWSKAAETNQHRFYTSSKEYVATLKLIEKETYKCKF